MTLGQKIAQKRKELGLSQEALGEQLGISRQAIYKWESNATLPEIEKLIALSRIFSVSVGWLLGEEEPAPAEDEAPSSHELNETQLQMVQEIVDRYLAAQPVLKPAKRRRWPFVLAGGAVLLAAAVLIHLSSRLNDLNNQYNNLQSSINNVTYSVNSQISSITNQVETILKSQNQLTASYDAALLSTDLAENTATFSVQAVPKSYMEGMTALFLADSGGELLEVPGELGPGQSFSAQLICPLTDSITLSVVFQTGEQRETQVLEQYYSLYSDSFPYVNIMGGLWGYMMTGGVLSADTIWVTSDSQYSVTAVNEAAPPAEIVQIQVGLFRNQQLVMWYEELDGKPANFQGDFGNARFFRRSEPVTMEPDCVYCEAALITDEYGRTFMVWDSPVQLDEEDNFADYVNSTYSSDPAEWTF